jgi:hypothetical protein
MASRPGTHPTRNETVTTGPPAAHGQAVTTGPPAAHGQAVTTGPPAAHGEAVTTGPAGCASGSPPGPAGPNVQR